MSPSANRPKSWAISGLLLLATMVNYMDRQTLANLSVRVTTELHLSNEQYGNLEFNFGVAFGIGSLVFGFLVDRLNVRWLYPAALLGWSAAGILTGLARSYEELLACRTALGFFEAGHWPCALVTTQRLLSRTSRTMGNSVLQSGGAIGAILTPLIVLGILYWADSDESVRQAHHALGGATIAAAGMPPTAWPLPFFIVGAAGTLWVLGWFALVRPGDLEPPANRDIATESVSIWAIFTDRRFLILLVTVTMINTTWQLVRAWLPKFLMQGRDYLESHALLFNSAYYVAADVGCLAAGGATLWLARRGAGVHRSRIVTFAVCALLTSLTAIVAFMPAGLPMLGVLLLVAAGSLGLFPCYYSFTQELSTTHMGKVTGLLGAFGWFISAPTQTLFGRVVDRTGSFDVVFGITGLMPLVGLTVMLLFWRRSDS